jgi:hypothetical protein
LDLLNKYGEEQVFTFASEESPGQPIAKGSPDMAMQELQWQRENSERCLTILTQCRTRDEIVEGFGRVARLLREANDPVAQAVEMALTTSRELPDEHVLQLRDDFISQFKAFLSSTESMAAEMPRPTGASEKRKRKPVWVLLIVGFLILAVVVCVIAALGVFLVGRV